MRNWEEDLPPIAKERLIKIGELTGEEKEKLVDSVKVDSILSEFYQGQIDSESLWKRLKEEAKPSLLKEAQIKLIDSLSFESTPGELQRKRDAILAIETLKGEQNTAIVERNLDLVGDLQRKYRSEIDQAYNGIRAEVEGNPRLRVKQVQQGESTMLVQLSVDEAIKQLPQWKDFLSDQEKRYRQEFVRIVEKLKIELK
jgi:hypothetical protein